MQETQQLKAAEVTTGIPDEIPHAIVANKESPAPATSTGCALRAGKFDFGYHVYFWCDIK